MEIRRSSILILILILVLLSQRSVSMRYELKSGQTKCIAEDIHKNSMSVGKYFIVNPNEDQPLPSSHKIHVQVMPPQGTGMIHEADNVESGQFSFTATETGNYLACISVVDHKPETTLTLDFDWRSGVHSVHSKDWSKVAKRTQVVMMEHAVKDLLDTVSSIHDEMFYLREREEEMQVLNRSTNAKMGWLSFVSLGVCLSVAGIQFWHLKTFFEKKKLI
ncbi:unnamed protein product [Arabis nemorensis]|uniref:GOLD domain-containing protein n=1 Tax=Arabis nemorensis TaxID=586526 RepID=A0A565BRF1_9BRAS|nr:unnamed protein product [Arabis nemorensis]